MNKLPVSKKQIMSKNAIETIIITTADGEKVEVNTADISSFADLQLQGKVLHVNILIENKLKIKIIKALLNKIL